MDGSVAHRTVPAFPTSTTTASIPYSYRLDAASCVPSVVSQTVGANKGLRVSDGNCTPQSPAADHRPADHGPAHHRAADHGPAHHAAERHQPQPRGRS